MSIHTAITKAFNAIMLAFVTHGYLQEEFSSILRQSITERLKSPHQRIMSTILFFSSFMTAAHHLHNLLEDTFERTSCMEMKYNGIFPWLEIRHILLTNRRKLRALLSCDVDFVRLSFQPKLTCKPWSCIACEPTATSLISVEEKVQVLNKLDSDIHRFWDDLGAIFCLSRKCRYCTLMFQPLAIVKCQDVTPCEGYGRKMTIRTGDVLVRQWLGHFPFVINAFLNSRSTTSHRGTSSRISRALKSEKRVSGSQISRRHHACIGNTCLVRDLRSRSEVFHSWSVEIRDDCYCPLTLKPGQRGFARALKVWLSEPLF